MLGVELAAQPARVAVEGPGLGDRIAQAPDVAQQLLLGEDPGRVGGEDAEQGELFLCEVHLAIADHDPAAGGVDQQVPHPQRFIAAAVASAEDRLDPGAEMLVAEWLTQMVVDGHAGVRVRPGIAHPGCQCDHRQARVHLGLQPMRTADATEKFRPRVLGELEIEQQEVGTMATTEPPCLLGRARRERLEAVGGEPVAE